MGAYHHRCVCAHRTDDLGIIHLMQVNDRWVKRECFSKPRVHPRGGVEELGALEESDSRDAHVRHDTRNDHRDFHARASQQRGTGLDMCANTSVSHPLRGDHHYRLRIHRWLTVPSCAGERLAERSWDARTYRVRLYLTIGPVSDQRPALLDSGIHMHDL
jgi:hypothetical protein